MLLTLARACQASQVTVTIVDPLRICGGVTFGLDAARFLVRSDNGAGIVDCVTLNDVFNSVGMAGLGEGVFANMPTLEEL